MASFALTSPRTDSDIASVCKEVVNLRANDQIPSPREVLNSSASSLADSQKANHGRMLLTMSLQELPAKDNDGLEDKLQEGHLTTPSFAPKNSAGSEERKEAPKAAEDKPEQNAVVPVSVGAILLMLSPLLII